MNIGRMRYRIKIEDYKSVIDQEGFITKKWLPVAKLWASISPVSGKEYFLMDTETGETTYKIQIRYIKGLNNAMRVDWEGRLFNINSLLEDKRRGFITIMASEIV